MALIKNKTAHRDFKIKETYEAGIALRGFEVKSLRAKHGSLKGAYVVVRGGEAFLTNAHIPAFQPANAPDDYDSYRTRKLLLHKSEIEELARFEQRGGVALVPVLGDLHADPDDPMVVLLQLGELLPDVGSEPVRDFAVPSGDGDVHRDLLSPARRRVLSRVQDLGPRGRVPSWSPPGRPGLRPHTRLLGRSQLLRHYWPSPASRRVGRRARGRTYH